LTSRAGIQGSAAAARREPDIATKKDVRAAFEWGWLEGAAALLHRQLNEDAGSAREYLEWLADEGWLCDGDEVEARKMVDKVIRNEYWLGDEDFVGVEVVQ
jgi:hypothetical protein